MEDASVVVFDTTLRDGEQAPGFSMSAEAKVEMAKGLRDLGVECGKEWLAKRFDALGVKSTVNIARDYLDDLRMPVEKAEPVQSEPPPPEPPHWPRWWPHR